MRNSAELASGAPAGEELTHRNTAMAHAATEAKDDAPASELYEVERALRVAARRLSRLGTPR
jgi:hypothetical protein